MLAKSCSRSQGQPVLGVRNAAMIASRRPISREGVITRILTGSRTSHADLIRAEKPRPCGVARYSQQQAGLPINAAMTTLVPCGPAPALGPGRGVGHACFGLYPSGAVRL